MMCYNAIRYIIIVIGIIIFGSLFCYVFFGTQQNNVTEEMTVDYKKTYWNRNQCPYVMNQTMIDELKSNNIQQSNTNWNLYFPCSYDNISKEVNEMPIVNNAKYFILENCDLIVAKDELWKQVVLHHGYDKAKTMMPNSYILYDNNDLKKFNIEYNSNKIYIMKKNIQRQEGLKITKNKNEIINGYNNAFVIVQELLQDPYCVSGRKINIRFYILVICKGNDTEVYVYDDGFMYYTKEKFRKNSLEDGPNITTGYIERQVYVDNPLTQKDFKVYLDNPNRQNLSIIEQNIRNQNMKISEICFMRINNLLKDVFISFINKLCGSKVNKRFNNSNITFQIFGADIAINDQLHPTIMEINKGPDLGAKDERDSMLKHNMVRDSLKLIGASNEQSQNGFINILSISNGSVNN